MGITSRTRPLRRPGSSAKDPVAVIDKSERPGQDDDPQTQAMTLAAP
jgi:hypothetical protein